MGGNQICVNINTQWEMVRQIDVDLTYHFSLGSPIDLKFSVNNILCYINKLERDPSIFDVKPI